MWKVWGIEGMRGRRIVLSILNMIPTLACFKTNAGAFDSSEQTCVPFPVLMLSSDFLGTFPHFLHKQRFVRFFKRIFIFNNRIFVFSCVSFSSILCCWLLAISWYFELPSFILYTWESCESFLLSWHRGSRWDGSRKSVLYATFRRTYILEFRGCSDRLLQEFHCMISLIQ